MPHYLLVFTEDGDELVLRYTSITRFAGAYADMSDGYGPDDAYVLPNDVAESVIPHANDEWDADHCHVYRI